MTNETAQELGRPCHSREQWKAHCDEEHSSGCPSSKSDESGEKYVQISEANFKRFGRKASKAKGRAQLTAFRANCYGTESRKVEWTSTASSTHKPPTTLAKASSCSESEFPGSTSSSLRSVPNSDNEYSHSDTERPITSGQQFYYFTYDWGEEEDVSDGNRIVIHKPEPKAVLKPRPKALLRPRRRQSGEYLSIIDQAKKEHATTEEPSHEPKKKRMRKKRE
jgi:hypothetical protein